MKKLLSILISAAVMTSSMINVFAVSDEFYSADETIIRQELTQMTDSEREEFINENLDIALQDMSTLVTLTAVSYTHLDVYKRQVPPYGRNYRKMYAD